MSYSTDMLKNEIMFESDFRMAIHRFFAVGNGIVCPDPCISSVCNPIRMDGKSIIDDESFMCTWKAVDSEWVTIIKMNDESTAIFFHYSMGLFLASPQCSLSIDCPIGSSFIGQVILDDGIDNEKIPSLMISDINTYGTNGMDSVDPIDRYRILRESCHTFFHDGFVRIQWVGHGDAAIDFCKHNSDCLPHRIDFVFYLPKSVLNYSIGRYLE